MPTDSYGQGVPWLDSGDTPDLRAATKGIADVLVPRGVMRFTDAAARNAAFGPNNPVAAGMIAWLTSEKQWTGYDGTSWVVLAAGESDWTTVSLASGWAHNGNAQGEFQYRLVNLFGEPTLLLRGGIARASYPSTLPENWTLTTSPLPVAARPTTLRTISVPCSDISSARITLKLDVQTDGNLVLYGTQVDSKPPWVGFNGCFTSL